MERLTAFDGEFWIHKNFPPVEEDRVDEFIDCVKDLASRLATIENILGDDYDLERLKELVQADREGKCVLLPCKVGDKLYKISENGVKEVVVQSIVFMLSHTVNHLTVHVANERGAMTEIETKDFGKKTVFLAREEAEVALEKMKKREK